MVARVNGCTHTISKPIFVFGNAFKITNSSEFLGNLLVEDRDEHVTFSMEFFLYQVNLLAAKLLCRNA